MRKSQKTSLQYNLLKNKTNNLMQNPCHYITKSAIYSQSTKLIIIRSFTHMSQRF